MSSYFKFKEQQVTVNYYKHLNNYSMKTHCMLWKCLLLVCILVSPYFVSCHHSDCGRKDAVVEVCCVCCAASQAVC